MHTARNNIRAVVSQDELYTMSEPLSESDLSEVVNTLHPVKRKWKEIGTNLNIAPSELDAIQHDACDLGERLYEMVRKWFASADNPTWTDIADALNCQSVGETRLSKDLPMKYCGRTPGIY